MLPYSLLHTAGYVVYMLAIWLYVTVADGQRLDARLAIMAEAVVTLRVAHIVVLTATLRRLHNTRRTPVVPATSYDSYWRQFQVHDE